MTKHFPPGDFKPPPRPRYAGPLPLCDSPLAGELRLHDLSRGLFEAFVFFSGLRIRLGVYCSRAAACRAIASAHLDD